MIVFALIDNTNLASMDTSRGHLHMWPYLTSSFISQRINSQLHYVYKDVQIAKAFIEN